MRTMVLLAVLAATGTAAGQTTRSNPDRARCAASGGEWRGSQEPHHCVCPAGKVNALEATTCPEDPGDYCIEDETGGMRAASTAAAMTPVAPRPVRRVTARRAVRAAPPPPAPVAVAALLAAPEITIDPVRQSDRPGREIAVRLAVTGATTGILAHVESGGTDCLIRQAGDLVSDRQLTKPGARSVDVLVYGAAPGGECLLTVRALGTPAQAQGLYLFTGEPVAGVARTARSSKDEACQVLCESWGRDARWDGAAKRCEPQDPTRYERAGQCTIRERERPAIALATVARPTSCEDICRVQGAIARWDAAASQCLPTNSATHVAVGCLVQLRPERGPQGPAGTTGAPGKAQEYPGFGGGLELHLAGFWSETDERLMLGPGVELRLDLSEAWEAAAHGGLILEENLADADVPIGTYLAGNLRWFLGGWWGFFAGGHAHFVRVDNSLKAGIVEYGGDVGLTARWWKQRCRATGGALLGAEALDESFAVGYGLTLGCGLP